MRYGLITLGIKITNQSNRKSIRPKSSEVGMLVSKDWKA